MNGQQIIQKIILEVIRERVSSLVDYVNMDDFREVFGTYDVGEAFADIFYGIRPLSLSRLEDTAECLGVTVDYLLGYSDDPSKNKEAAPDAANIESGESEQDQ